ncbi:redoxin family protein [Methanogenium sp. S4BF]|uniref:peroxiredoxin family protein n=1 Tax=Methanogenium sp. S4BF TaxID=1789226 RepID=UPI002417045C|nr:redoxin domain-containing protein [Methanogenium sp. S4BF]WFN33819.1 redoxin family protein [Methanogenium sp. S4BF]
MEKKTILVLLLIALVGIVIVAALLFPGDPGAARPYDISSAGWLTVPLTDALTGETVTLQGLRDGGQTVIVQTFTLSCPICTAQLGELTRLQADYPQDVVVVGLSLDASVSAGALEAHAEDNGLTVIMAASPASLTTGLVEGWGRDMLVPAYAPVVLFCPTGNTAYKLRNGLKSSEEVWQSVSDSCA